MWIVLLTCETHLVYTVQEPVRGPTRAIEGPHRAGVEFRSLAEDFDTATSTGKLQLSMVLAFNGAGGTRSGSARSRFRLRREPRVDSLADGRA